MRTIRVYAAGLLLLLVACRGPEDAFTRRVAARARERAEIRSVEIVGRLHLKLTLGKGAEHDMYLDNLWRDCEAQPDACDKGIDRSIRLVSESQGANEAFAKPEAVRAVLKDPQWMSNVEKMMAQAPPDKRDGARLVSRPFAADLTIVYVFDLPDGMRMINREALAQLKLDEDGLHALAVKNLEAGLPALAGEPIEAGSAVRVVHVGNNYEASTLILHDRWAEIARQVKGDLIVAVPSRDFVYFTGSREDVAGLRTVAHERDDSHPLTTTLLRWTAQGWEAVP